MTLAVKVKNLCVKFGDFVAVNQISLEVPRGEIFGFLGANGAGKTTTIRVLCGLLLPTSGEVLVAGMGFEDGGSQVKARVGYMSQKFTLYNDLTVEENLSFAASLRKINRDIYHTRRDTLLEFISFPYPLQTFVRDLPGGIKQQVSLAAALLHDPEIVFLDEPTAGVTPASRKRFWALIRNLAKQGKTVFVTTHYMDEAEQCDRIALMRSGSIIALDTPARLKKNAFPQNLYELEPLRDLTYAQIQELKQNEAIEFFEPYGRRFHITLRAPLDDHHPLNVFLRENFKMKVVPSTLEDVFIHLVEGGAS
jgi:ABC-2 type transport system ATP-binding protein